MTRTLELPDITAMLKISLLPLLAALVLMASPVHAMPGMGSGEGGGTVITLEGVKFEAEELLAAIESLL